MPELPEVETVRRGLAPAMEARKIIEVRVARPDLRFPFPDRFGDRLEGAIVRRLSRRGKYLTAALSTGETLIAHLGMTGRFTVSDQGAPGRFHHETSAAPKHDHVVLRLEDGVTITYNDARRFGFMDLVETEALEGSKHFARMGPEPLSADFSPTAFNEALKTRQTPVKSALLDQAIVAGIGNIYACEALFRAGVSPRRKASSVAGVRGRRLHGAIVDVLTDAIEAGGSTLRDFASSDGALGYFQHRFQVYDREGAPCYVCGTPIRRLVQSGRSTFFCPHCQR